MFVFDNSAGCTGLKSEVTFTHYFLLHTSWITSIPVKIVKPHQIWKRVKFGSSAWKNPNTSHALHSPSLQLSANLLPKASRALRLTAARFKQWEETAPQDDCVPLLQGAAHSVRIDNDAMANFQLCYCL